MFLARFLHVIAHCEGEAGAFKVRFITHFGFSLFQKLSFLTSLNTIIFALFSCIRFVVPCRKRD
jgi:hypothetical protein